MVSIRIRARQPPRTSRSVASIPSSSGALATLALVLAGFCLWRLIRHIG